MSIPDTPLTKAHPEYWGMLTQDGWDNRDAFPKREYFQLRIVERGRIAFESAWIPVEKLDSVDLFVRFYLSAAGFRVYLYWRSITLRQSFSLPVLVGVDRPEYRLFKSGIAEVRLIGTEERYHAAVRKARRVAPSRENSQFGRTFWSASLSGPLRPASESVNRGFLKYTETAYPYVLITYPLVAIPNWSREWTGSRTPGFATIKKRDLPVNAHHVDLRSFGVNADYYGSFVFSTGNYDVRIRPFTENMSVPSPDGHLDLAASKALKRLISEAGTGIEANLAQDFAQMSQLTTLLGGTAKKLVKSVNYLRKLNFSAAVNTLTAGRSRSRMPAGKPSRKKDLAENWLELQYGWKPLLMDIEGLLKSLSIFNSANSHVCRVAASGSALSVKTSNFETHMYPTIGNNMGRNYTRTETRCKYVCYYRIESPLTSFLAQTGFTNPINLAWEILPFSFVVDWFLPIGPYLEALSAWDGLTFVEGSQTRFTRCLTRLSVDYEGVNKGNPSGQIRTHSRYERERILLDRARLTTFPSATIPELKAPFASCDFAADSIGRMVQDCSHALNGIALLTAAFKTPYH